MSKIIIIALIVIAVVLLVGTIYDHVQTKKRLAIAKRHCNTRSYVTRLPNGRVDSVTTTVTCKAPPPSRRQTKKKRHPVRRVSFEDKGRSRKESRSSSTKKQMSIEDQVQEEIKRTRNSSQDQGALLETCTYRQRDIDTSEQEREVIKNHKTRPSDRYFYDTPISTYDESEKDLVRERGRKYITDSIDEHAPRTKYDTCEMAM